MMIGNEIRMQIKTISMMKRMIFLMKRSRKRKKKKKSQRKESEQDLT
jgi:hypothetical protein